MIFSKNSERRAAGVAQVGGDHRQRDVKTDPIDRQQTDGQQDLLAKLRDRKNDAQLFKHASGPSWNRAAIAAFVAAQGFIGLVEPIAESIGNRMPHWAV